MGFPQRRSRPPLVLSGSASPDVTIALTGVGATCAAGLLGVALALGLAGVVGTSTAGTVAGTSTVAVTGVAGSTAIGTVPYSSTVAVTGVTGSTAAGIVSVSGSPDVTQALTGVSGSAAAGVVAVATAVPVSGVQGTGGVGTVTVLSSNVTLALSGVGAIGALGRVTASGGVATFLDDEPDAAGWGQVLPVTPSDTVDLQPGSARLTDALYVGVAGDVAAVQQNGVAVLFTAVPAGGVLEVQVRRVNATGTTATGIAGLYA